MKVWLYMLTLDFLASYFQNKMSDSDKKMFDLGKEAGSWRGSSPVLGEQQQMEVGKAIVTEEICTKEMFSENTGSVAVLKNPTKAHLLLILLS